ncbi:hypothetical protein [Actinoplanes sp. NPDC051859]|uniref:hypothetical protein n=1 Tax=Actinoplanes sp. NPDC051859 TaxID=3363909 RepID=UPI0037B089EF
MDSPGLRKICASALSAPSTSTSTSRSSKSRAFTPKAVSLDAHIEEFLLPPASELTEDVHHAGTKTLHEYRSRTYAFTDREGAPVLLRLSPAAVLTSARHGDATLNYTLSYTYGPQHTKPAGYRRQRAGHPWPERESTA